MIWCTFDIVKFRRQWMDLTAGARDHEEYMGITQRHPDIMFYFPDIHNTGGLFYENWCWITLYGWFNFNFLIFIIPVDYL